MEPVTALTNGEAVRLGNSFSEEIPAYFETKDQLAVVLNPLTPRQRRFLALEMLMDAMMDALPETGQEVYEADMALALEAAIDDLTLWWRAWLREYFVWEG